MTRINCSVKPSELSNKHLLAELREIKRIPNLVINGNVHLNNIPKEFTLGTGHVRFFYDKIKYLHDRYIMLYNEAKNIRNFNVSDYSNSFELVKKQKNHLYNDYKETIKDRQLLLERLCMKDNNFYQRYLTN